MSPPVSTDPGHGSESSPTPTRKMSSSSVASVASGGQEHRSPVLQHKLRPSKLPVMPSYTNTKIHSPDNNVTKSPRPYLKKFSPPSSVDQDQIPSSIYPSNKYVQKMTSKITSKRAASPTSRTSSKRPGQASPKRGDISRRVSSPAYAARRRSPSLTRSVSVSIYNLLILIWLISLFEQLSQCPIL